MHLITDPAIITTVLHTLHGHHRPSYRQRSMVIVGASCLIVLMVLSMGYMLWIWHADIPVLLFLVSGALLVIGIACFLIYNVTEQYFAFAEDRIQIHFNHLETHHIRPTDICGLIVSYGRDTVGLYSLYSLTILTMTGRQYLLPCTFSMVQRLRAVRVIP
jgi:hypothetical protein